MKKTLNLILAIMVMATIITINTNTVSAQNNGYYDFYCPVGQYEVSYITDDGDFEKISCHDNYSEAVEEMHENDDYVVRDYRGKSPTMIIAMNSGNAYSYPYRGNKVTMNIYEHPSTYDIYYKQTYIAAHYEMKYETTERYLGDGTGMIQVTINGFSGYADLEYTDLVPDKFLDNELPIYLGDTVRAYNETPYKITLRRNYYTIVDDELVFRHHYAYPTSKGYDTEYSIVLGPAPEGFEANTRYYSSTGYIFYYDPQETEYALTYYPYYQYLPLRSETDITGDELDDAFYSIYKGGGTSKMENEGDTFIEAQKTYGINALLLYAMAAHESAWGTSSYAVNRNNLFGWNAIDSNPDNASYFDSVAQAVNEHAGYNLRKYTDVYSSMFFGSHVGNKGSGFNVKYASDPYWGMDIAAIAYQIDKENGLKDYNKYDLGVVEEFNAEFYGEDGTFYFSSAYGPYYQECFTVIVLGQSNGQTIVQSPNPIDDGEVIITYKGQGVGDGPTRLEDDVYPYDFDESVIYIDSESIVMINDGNYTDRPNDKPNERPDVTGTNKSIVNSITTSDQTMKIDGLAFTIGYDYESPTTHEVMIYDADTNKKVMSVETKTYEEPLNYNDGHVYDYIGYQATIDLSELDAGNYYLMISVDGTTPFAITDSSFTRTGTYNTIISSNTSYNGRIELTILPMDYRISGLWLSSIEKPAQRASVNDSVVSFEGDDLYVNGNGWIFYTDFLNTKTTRYQIYMISEDNYYLLDMGDGDYNEDLVEHNDRVYSNTYENIFYDGDIDLKTIEKGEYVIYLSIDNGDYFDFIALTDYSEPSYTMTINDYNFELTTNSNGEVILIVD